MVFNIRQVDEILACLVLSALWCWESCISSIVLRFFLAAGIFCYFISKRVFQGVECDIRLAQQEVEFAKKYLDESEDKWSNPPEIGSILAEQLLQDSHRVLHVYCLNLYFRKSSLEIACYPKWLEFITQMAFYVVL